ncbi:MAG: hypothetical protein EAZ33_03205 [Oscillatoriales cyanobacterium]|nr:MAG: hypothetical protein EAZ33_03205 [Oscillatoriales cyanobacterium]
MQKLTPADWEELKSCWCNRSQEWQLRCAEIISDADSQQAIPLLLEMLEIAPKNGNCAAPKLFPMLTLNKQFRCC